MNSFGYWELFREIWDCFAFVHCYFAACSSVFYRFVFGVVESTCEHTERLKFDQLAIRVGFYAFEINKLCLNLLVFLNF